MTLIILILLYILPQKIQILTIRSLWYYISLELQYLALLAKYSLRPSRFFTLSFLGCPSRFFTSQNFPKIVNFYNIKTNLTHYFHPLSPIYQLNINGSHHFTHFSYFLHYFILTLYIFLNLRAHPRCKQPGGTEGVV